jgi:hypothetical protein
MIGLGLGWELGEAFPSVHDRRNQTLGPPISYSKGGDRRATAGEKHTPQGAVDQSEGVDKAQADARRGKGKIIESGKRSRGVMDHELGKIKTLEDANKAFKP